ncbi:MAG: MFS transporter [Rickettsiales bacterium]
MFFWRAIPIIVISATLIMRPIGGIYFGYIGDKYGRKKGLFASIIFMIIPTFIIGILPTYNQIYIMAPIILIICRMIQGFSMGGETGGTNTILVEASKNGFISMTTSLLPAAIMLGGVLASIVTYCININLFSWRFGYIIGALLGFVSFYFRYKMSETDQFKVLADKKMLLKNPLKDIFKTNKEKMLCAFLMSFGAVVPFHLNYVYMADFLRNTLNVPIAKIAFFNVITQVISIILMPMFGFLADKIDKKAIMYAALIILMFISYPLILYNNTNPSIFYSNLIQIALCISLSMYSGAYYSSVALLFSVNKRYTASGFSVSVGVAIFSFLSSFFIWSSYKNNLFLYTIVPMLLFFLLNTKMIMNYSIIIRRRDSEQS